MKKIILSFIYIFFTCLLQSYSFGQACKCDSGLSSGIENDVAKARIEFFDTIKAKIINGAHVNVSDLTISKDDFIKVFKNIRDSAHERSYNGVRIYFAITNKELNKNKLTILLVPTIHSSFNDDNDDEISDDDSTNAFLFYNNTFNNVNLITNGKDVIKGINQYENIIAKRIENTLDKKYNIKLAETHSLWYSDSVLFIKGSYGCDLLDYLDSTCSNKIKDLKIKFASWVFDKNYPDELKFVFKTDLIFELTPSANQLKYFTLSALEINKTVSQALTGSYADTGLPCPPNKCPY